MTTYEIQVKKNLGILVHTDCDGESQDTSVVGVPRGIEYDLLEDSQISTEEINYVSESGKLPGNIGGHVHEVPDGLYDAAVVGMQQEGLSIDIIISVFMRQVSEIIIAVGGTFIAGCDDFLVVIDEYGEVVDIVGDCDIYYLELCDISLWTLTPPSSVQIGTEENLLGPFGPDYTNAPQLAGATIRHVIPAENFISGIITTHFMVEMLHTGSDWYVSEVWVGQKEEGTDCNFDGNKVQLTYNGNTYANINYDYFQSDEVEFEFDTNKDMVFSVYFEYGQYNPISNSDLDFPYSAWAIMGNYAEDDEVTASLLSSSLTKLVGFRRIVMGIKRASPRKILGVSNYHAVGVNSAGECVSLGENGDHEGDVFSWGDVHSIVCCEERTIGLKTDGTCLYTGGKDDDVGDISSWENVVCIDGDTYSSNWVVGVKVDGTCYYAGEIVGGLDEYPDVRADVESWTDIIEVSTFNYNIVGLKKDGTCVITGRSESALENIEDVESWTDIVQIACGWRFVVGLKSDGTCVHVGDSDYGQNDVYGWTSIQQIIANHSYVAGVKSDGSVVKAGLFNYEV